MIPPHSAWEGVLRLLGSDIPSFALEAWLRPLAVEIDGARVRLLAPNRLHCERIATSYLPALREAFGKTLKQPVDVQVEVGEARADAVPAQGPPLIPARASVSSAPARTRSRLGPQPEARKVPPAQVQYDFDSFVVGPTNALAREASVALANGRQLSVSPLFLLAPTGCGKTHLAQAVAGEARRRNDSVIYASAETFTNQLLASIRSRKTDVFKRRFRGCKLLVLEDIQFLEGKKATQLELFHTLDHLQVAGAGVVFTGDRLPRNLDRVDPALCSRLASGLVAEIEPPDAQLRRQILRSKAAAGGVRIPEPCLDRLVEEVRGSVRDLEGALIQLVASSALLKRRIDLELTEAALRKLRGDAPSRRPLDPREVIRTVAAFFGTSPADLASRSRRRDVLVPRQIAMYLCRSYTEASMSAIGRELGRDHPSVKNAVAVVERAVLERAPLRYRVEELSKRLDALADEVPKG